MESFDRIQFLEAALDRQLAWISAAESKSSFVFAVNTTMLGLLAAVSPTSAAAWSVGAAIFGSFAVTLGLASLLFLSFASFPRTHGPRNSLIYFGGIAQREADQYLEAVKAVSPDAHLEDLSAQCHRNAEIALRKFAWVRRALISQYLSVVPWGLAIFQLYSAAK